MGAYIVSAEDANDFAATVQLDEQPLVEVLQQDNRLAFSHHVHERSGKWESPNPIWDSRTMHTRTYLLEFWLRGRHLVVGVRRGPSCWAIVGDGLELRCKWMSPKPPTRLAWKSSGVMSRGALIR
jgi:hypothetical protein